MVRNRSVDGVRREVAQRRRTEVVAASEVVVVDDPVEDVIHRVDRPRYERWSSRSCLRSFREGRPARYPARNPRPPATTITVTTRACVVNNKKLTRTGRKFATANAISRTAARTSRTCCAVTE